MAAKKLPLGPRLTDARVRAVCRYVCLAGALASCTGASPSATGTPAGAPGQHAPPPAGFSIDFESDDAKAYSLSAGRVTDEAAVIVNGRRSLAVSSYGEATEWFEFLRTKANLTPGYVYTARVTFRVVRAEAGAGFYMLFRSEGKGYGKFDRGWKKVDDIDKLVGKAQTHTIEVGLANRYDYGLVLGLNGAAEVVVDDIEVTPGSPHSEPSPQEVFRNSIPRAAQRVAFHDFETGGTRGLAPRIGAIVEQGALSGGRSLQGDTTASSSEWNTFYSTPSGYFRPDGRYFVILRYRMLEADDSTRLYALIRSPQGHEHDVILKDWKLPSGSEGELHFHTAVYWSQSDYTLSMGLQNRGKVLIDDIEVFEERRPPNQALIDRKPFDPKTAKLVFEETFDGTAIDTTRWKIVGDERRRGGMWRKRNCSVDGKGRLVMKFDQSDGTYNGCSLETHEKFKFGYFEASIQFNKHPGHWIGFWLFDGAVNTVGNDGRDGTEIDIVESPWRGKDKASHALHWDGYGEDHRGLGFHPHVPNLDHGFHTFGVDWFEAGYVFYVNGKETWRTYAGEGCQVPLAILLTDELGGWSGTPVDAELPDHAYVDWVRAYAHD
jgi:hypothetical protein